MTLLGAVIAIVVLVVAFARQPWDPGASSQSSPTMTLEGVLALVSREHAGCPEQPLLVLSANAVYEGDGKWRVTYRDYEWTVDESDRSVETIGEPLPCPGS